MVVAADRDQGRRDEISTGSRKRGQSVNRATLKAPAALRGSSISNEGVRITSQVVLENPAYAQWRTSDDRQHLEVTNKRRRCL